MSWVSWPSQKIMADGEFATAEALEAREAMFGPSSLGSSLQEQYPNQIPFPHSELPPLPPSALALPRTSGETTIAYSPPPTSPTIRRLSSPFGSPARSRRGVVLPWFFDGTSTPTDETTVDVSADGLSASPEFTSDGALFPLDEEAINSSPPYTTPPEIDPLILTDGESEGEDTTIRRRSATRRIFQRLQKFLKTPKNSSLEINPMPNEVSDLGAISPPPIPTHYPQEEIPPSDELQPPALDEKEVELRVSPDGLDHIRHPANDIHHVTIVGIHGWFPQKWLHSITGPPKGVSPKFAYFANRAVRQYLFQQHGIALPHDAISPIPLEFEGKVDERVAVHFRQITGYDHVDSGFQTNDSSTSAKPGSPIANKPHRRSISQPVTPLGFPIRGSDDSLRSSTGSITQPNKRMSTLSDRGKPVSPRLSNLELPGPASIDGLAGTSPPSPPVIGCWPQQANRRLSTLLQEEASQRPHSAAPGSPFPNQSAPPTPPPIRRDSAPLSRSSSLPDLALPPPTSPSPPPSPYFAPKDAHVYLPPIPPQSIRDRIETADLLMFAAHSQGVVVTAMLLALLVQEGIVRPMEQRVVFLAMAGIAHGPFPAIKQLINYIETPAARELFELCSADNDLHKRFRSAMDFILQAGIKVVAVASWFDEVVPLYSALMHGFDHPSILRAIYIESTDYRGTEDFLTSLVLFSISLRNRGLSDMDLALHLTKYVSGSFYGGVTSGHSTLYEEVETYELALSFALTRDRLSTSMGTHFERKKNERTNGSVSLERLSNADEIRGRVSSGIGLANVKAATTAVRRSVSRSDAGGKGSPGLAVALLEPEKRQNGVVGSNSPRLVPIKKLDRETRHPASITESRISTDQSVIDEDNLVPANLRNTLARIPNPFPPMQFRSEPFSQGGGNTGGSVSSGTVNSSASSPSGSAQTNTNYGLKNNFYVLAFAVGKLLGQCLASTGELRAEAEDLVRKFEVWEPTGRNEKELKSRLEGIRGLSESGWSTAL